MPATSFPGRGIQNLIQNNKGDRSYERLAADCGGNVKARNLHRLATEPLLAFPSIDTIVALRRGLNQPLAEIIMACARSAGLDVDEDREAVLPLVGAKNLPKSSQDLLVSLAREMARLQEAAA